MVDAARSSGNALTLHARVHGQTHTSSLQPDASFGTFLDMIAARSQTTREYIRVLYRGAVLKTGDADRELQELFRDGDTCMVLISSPRDVDALRANEADAQRRSRIERGLDQRPEYHAVQYHQAPSAKAKYFRDVKVLNAFSSPPPAEARKLLDRIRTDPAVQSIMEKRGWKVGLLSELAPSRETGLIGESATCLLGYNKNHGEEICLRLRTSDFEGFRTYTEIRKVLMHELAHNVYSEHDNNFKELNSILNREYEAFARWSVSPDGFQGDSRGFDFINDEEESISARELAASAAIVRSEASVSANQENGGAEAAVFPAETDHTVTQTDLDSSSVVKQPSPHRGQAEDRFDIETVEMDHDSTLPREEQQGNVAKAATAAGTSSIKGSQQIDSREREESPGLDVHRALSTDVAVQSEDPSLLFWERLSSTVENIYEEVALSENRRVAIETLRTYIANIVANPQEDRYRRINKSNKAFVRRVWQYNSAKQYLLAVGFVETEHRYR